MIETPDDLYARIAPACAAASVCEVSGTVRQYERDAWRFETVTAARKVK